MRTVAPRQAPAVSQLPAIARVSETGCLAAIYLTLLADVVLFFARPLFSPDYIFPWDFRGVQLPLITFLRDELRQGRFALWNPFSYCGYPVFANIEACYFQPFVFLSVLVSLLLPPEMLPKLIEWAVVLQVWGLRPFTCAVNWARAVRRRGRARSCSRPAGISLRRRSTSER